MKKMFYPKSPFLKNQLVESQLFARNQPNLDQLLQWLCQTPSITTYRVNLLLSSVEHFKKRLHSLLSTKCNPIPDIFLINEIPEIVCISSQNQLPPICQPDLKEVMVDASCGAALLRGAHVFAPGVLSMQTGTKLDETVNVFADLDGKCKKGTNTAYVSDQKVFIGVGNVKMQRYQLYGEHTVNQGIAIEMSSTISGVPSIGDLSSGEALLQNFPSIVCVRVLDPRPGEMVLDMCSAPGNKTTHIAELMKDSGIVIALDKTDRKADLVRRKLEIHQLKSVKVFAFDSTKALNVDNKKKVDTPPFAPETFDRILLDAPCSALGNRPLLANSLTPKMLKSFPNVQRKLLQNAIGLLKKSGTLVYSTCSIAEEENEGMVAWVLKQYPEIRLVEATPIFGGPGTDGCHLSGEQRLLVQRFGPRDYNRKHEIDSIGFFIAKFVKSS